MSDATLSPPASPEKPQQAQAGSPNNGVSFITVVIVSFIISGFSCFTTYQFMQNHPPQLVATVNASKLVDANARRVLKPGITAEEAAKAGDVFVKKLDSILHEYSAAGMLVVNSNLVINKVPQIDITEQVLRQLDDSNEQPSATDGQ
ncbi:hypothetical protein [Herbaspirillum huttiense]|uniref:hypothetical protein n=1 Tax=Herbaspirillum huttiense TaxID=863372 RepID=UPI0039B1275A